MATLLNGQGLTKSFGAAALFREIGFVVDEGDRIGLIGPNGSGNSTLLGVLAGEIEPDGGEVARRKLTRLSPGALRVNWKTYYLQKPIYVREEARQIPIQ